MNARPLQYAPTAKLMERLEYLRVRSCGPRDAENLERELLIRGVKFRAVTDGKHLDNVEPLKG